MGLVLLGATLFAALGLGWLVWRGPEPGGIDEAYVAVFGGPDLGPVDFGTLERRRTPNDALAAPADATPRATPDLTPPVLPVPTERLREIVAAVAQADGAELIYSDRHGDQDRYLARSRLFRFPDTIDAVIIPAGEGRSTLALYARSQIGFSDLGVNRARLERWLKAIEARAR